MKLITDANVCPYDKRYTIYINHIIKPCLWNFEATIALGNCSQEFYEIEKKERKERENFFFLFYSRGSEKEICNSIWCKVVKCRYIDSYLSQKFLLLMRKHLQKQTPWTGAHRSGDCHKPFSPPRFPRIKQRETTISNFSGKKRRKKKLLWLFFSHPRPVIGIVAKADLRIKIKGLGFWAIRCFLRRAFWVEK